MHPIHRREWFLVNGVAVISAVIVLALTALVAFKHTIPVTLTRWFVIPLVLLIIADIRRAADTIAAAPLSYLVVISHILVVFSAGVTEVGSTEFFAGILLSRAIAFVPLAVVPPDPDSPAARAFAAKPRMGSAAGKRLWSNLKTRSKTVHPEFPPVPDTMK
ncbi:MAG: hypothetical protein LBR29_11635 [Methylobacteriaceae bacterium]|jgi:hypothetical protein|nr:hypothetical protein [Methylobacteriaceae bacterium]